MSRLSYDQQIENLYLSLENERLPDPKKVVLQKDYKTFAKRFVFGATFTGGVTGLAIGILFASKPELSGVLIDLVLCAGMAGCASKFLVEKPVCLSKITRRAFVDIELSEKNLKYIEKVCKEFPRLDKALKHWESKAKRPHKRRNSFLLMGDLDKIKKTVLNTKSLLEMQENHQKVKDLIFDDELKSKMKKEKLIKMFQKEISQKKDNCKKGGSDDTGLPRM